MIEIVCQIEGPVAQLGARMTGSHEVEGSSPSRSTSPKLYKDKDLRILKYSLYMAPRALYNYRLLPLFTPLGKRNGKRKKADSR